jgi:hypothetical protein
LGSQEDYLAFFQRASATLAAVMPSARALPPMHHGGGVLAALDDYVLNLAGCEILAIIMASAGRFSLYGPLGTSNATSYGAWRQYHIVLSEGSLNEFGAIQDCERQKDSDQQSRLADAHTGEYRASVSLICICKYIRKGLFRIGISDSLNVCWVGGNPTYGTASAR